MSIATHEATLRSMPPVTREARTLDRSLPQKTLRRTVAPMNGHQTGAAHSKRRGELAEPREQVRRGIFALRNDRFRPLAPSALCPLTSAPALVAPARPAPSCSAPSRSAPRTEKPAPGRTRRRAVYQLVCEPKPASEPDRDPTATAWPTRHPDLNRTAPEGPPAGDLACGPGQAVRRPPDPTRSVSSQCLSAPLHRSAIRHRSSAVPLGTAFGVRSPAGHPQNASLSGRVRQHPGPKQDRLARVAPCRFP